MSALLRFVFFLGDLLFLNLSIVLSYSFFDVEILGEQKTNSVYLFIFSNLTWLFLIVVSNPYNYSRSWGIPKIIKSQLSFIFIHLLVVASLIFFFKKNYAPSQIVTMYLLFVPTFFAWKLFLVYVTNLFTNTGIGERNIIIVGQGDLAREVRRYFLIHPELKYRFLMLFEKKADALPLSEIQKFCKDREVHEIYCCLPEIDNADLKRLIDFGLDSLIRVKLIADFRSFQQKSLELEHYDHIPVFNITTIPLDSVKNQVFKRVFDIAFSVSVAVIILSWLFPIIAIAIKLNSKGPVFFKQKRSGRDNKPFTCFKFRTMVVNKEADTRQASADDRRITKLGHILRRTSLDELPQFLNVLQGNMSIVGPRPHMLRHTEEYSKLIEKFMGRHYVKPGITGLAQCMGYRGETKNIIDMKNRVKLDRFYIENWSLVFDIRIIFQTVVSILRANENAF
jgi:Undecaprenyl-phosphate glucose phosphotransferase